MRILEKEVYKYIDVLFNRIEDYNLFNIKNILYKHIQPTSDLEKDYFFTVIKEVKLFGKNNDLFEVKTKDSWAKLTKKGIEFKKSEKTYLKYNKLVSTTPVDWYKIVPIVLSVVFFCFNFYQRHNYNQLKINYNSIKTQNDSLQLNKRNSLLKDYIKIDSLNVDI
jgi:hypothetical protein